MVFGNNWIVAENYSEPCQMNVFWNLRNIWLNEGCLSALEKVAKTMGGGGVIMEYPWLWNPYQMLDRFELETQNPSFWVLIWVTRNLSWSFSKTLNPNWGAGDEVECDLWLIKLAAPWSWYTFSPHMGVFRFNLFTNVYRRNVLNLAAEGWIPTRGSY